MPKFTVTTGHVHSVLLLDGWHDTDDTFDIGTWGIEGPDATYEAPGLGFTLLSRIGRITGPVAAIQALATPR